MERGSEPNEFIDDQEQIEVADAEYYRPQAESYGDYIEFEEGRPVGPQERESFVRNHVRDTVALYHHQRSDRELNQYQVSWDDITSELLDNLSHALEQATREEDMQRFLSENSIFLIQHLGGGHGRYVIPKQELGAELVPDYLIAEMSSFGLEWHGVELESPLADYFTLAGQPRSILTHAVQQILDWRAWLQSNIAYARNPKSDRGLGLVGITSDLPSTILIGRRRTEIPTRFNDYRRQIKTSLNIEIHTYDWLIEQSEIRIRSLERSNEPDSFDI